jgi:hypothetical protein
MRTWLAITLWSACLITSGCGPLTMPMAHRLDEKGQQEFDAGWDRALSPVDRLDHQSLLDMICGVQAYQYGVDKLHFRSEKAFATGTIVMEVHFDRTLPDADRFEVSVVDAQGKVLRSERYNRQEVEQTYRDLFQSSPSAAEPGQEAQLAERQKQLEARRQAIAELFPDHKPPELQPEDDGDAPADAADAAQPDNRT